MCLKSKMRSGKCGSVGKMLAWHAQRPEVQSLVLHSLSGVATPQSQPWEEGGWEIRSGQSYIES